MDFLGSIFLQWPSNIITIKKVSIETIYVEKVARFKHRSKNYKP